MNHNKVLSFMMMMMMMMMAGCCFLFGVGQKESVVPLKWTWEPKYPEKV